MNIQIFGKAKCFDTKKAERYFKERNIKFQSIDIVKYGISPGEYSSIKSAVGGMRNLIDGNAKAYKEHFIEHLASEVSVEEKLIENPSLFKTPIVRNGRKATIGFQPEIWKAWENDK